jgi:hypothetical protein
MKTYCDECKYGKYNRKANCDIICSYKENKIRIMSDCHYGKG